ncbi:MAG: phytanoyl-CoA dioxygenase family protein [Alphaproteobacteria bacterium]|nr:MAG: phytanoyl-CoA dioxygenase family protein [Alphaproteobacteria bacterium]
MTRLQRVSKATNAEEILNLLSTEGAFIIENLIDADLLKRLNDELMPYIDATPNGRDRFVGFQTTRTGALVARSEAFRELVQNKTILAACDTFLKPNCERYQLHLSQVIRLRPGQPAQAIHRDRWAWGTHLKGVEPQLNTLWALTDFTAENGATQVVPGSVDWPDDRRPEPGEIEQAVMPAGSVLVYSGTVFHGGGENKSANDRIALNVDYSLGWLRQEENQYLSCPPDIAKDLSPDLQSLIGYSLGGFAMGYYTPPLPPGEGPEVVSPGYAVGQRIEDSTMGDQELLDAIAEQTGGKPN